MPTLTKAGWIFFLRTAARSSGFFPLQRRDGKTKSPGPLCSVCDFHSSNASFSARCIGNTLADASVFVAFRCPPLRQCTASDYAYDVLYQLTGKERDSESGLDNFEARYLGSSLGRFMSPDPENAGASAAAPQSWNAYAYVMN